MNYGNSVRFLGEQTEGSNRLTFYLRILCGILNLALNRSFRRVFDDRRLIDLRRSDSGDQIQKALLEIAKELLSEIDKEKFRGRRWASVMKWIRYGVPLYAAPESGLSTDDAGKWLNFFDSDSHELTAEDCVKLREIRRRRAAQALERAVLQTPCQRDAEDLLHELDGLDPDHPWLRRIEQRARTQQPAEKSSPRTTARKVRGHKQPATAKGTTSTRRRGSQKPKKET